MQIRDKLPAALAAAGFSLLVGFSSPGLAEPSGATSKKPADTPIVLSKFSKQKTQASAKSRSKTTHNEHRAKLADAVTRGKSSKSNDVLAKLSALPSVANARAELTKADPSTLADDEARNIAATDENEVVTMSGVQIASADQLNDIDRAMAEDKTEVKADDVPVAEPVPPISSGRIIKAAPSGDRHVVTTGESDPWSKTSLIGKIFVAFGSLLTLASAARLIIA